MEGRLPILKVGMRLPAIILFCGCLWLSACHGKIDGVVYLDSNGNGAKEPEEGRLAGVVLKAYDEDNEIIGTVTTDSKGQFHFSTPGPADYCIMVEKSSLAPATGLSAPALHVRAVQVQKDLFSAGPSTTTPSTATSPTTTATSTTTTAPSTSTTTVSANPGTTSANSNPAPVRKNPAPPGTLCSGTNTLSVRLDVAVQRDYAAALNQFPQPSQQIYQSGDTFTIKLPHPEECQLESLFLPDVLELAHTTQPQLLQFDPSLNQVAFLQPPPTDAKAAVIDAATLDVRELNVRVRDDIAPGEHSVSIAPKALCPGDKEIDLPTIALTIKAAPRVELRLHLDGLATLGGVLPFTIEASNKGGASYKEVRVLMTAANGLQISQVDQGCNNLGMKAECLFDLAPKATVKRQLRVQLPKSLESSPTQYTIDGQLTIPDVDPIKAEAIVFWLENPPAK